MKPVTILFLSTLFINTWCIQAQESRTLKSELAEGALNYQHPYFSDFKKKDSAYITWLYYQNKASQSEFNKKGNYRFSSRNGNQPLVFKITEGNTVFQDTLRNSIHPKKTESRHVAMPLSGNLPDGVWLSLDTNIFNKTIIKIYNKKEEIDIKLSIYDKDDNLIETLQNGTLNKGEFTFKWKPRQSKENVYFLRTQVNKNVMVQQIVTRTFGLKEIFGISK